MPDLLDHANLSGGIIALLFLLLHRNHLAGIVTDTLFKRIDELEETLLKQTGAHGDLLAHLEIIRGHLDEKLGVRKSEADFAQRLTERPDGTQIR